MKLPALFAKLPRPRVRPKAQEIVPAKARESFPALADDCETLDEVLLEDFNRLDEEAGRAQNAYRLTRLIVICGGSAATVLGALQAALADSLWPGIAAGAVSAVLVSINQVQGSRDYGARFVRSRLCAERLRAEAFLFLARADVYAEGDAQQTLRRRVARIKQELRA